MKNLDEPRLFQALTLLDELLRINRAPRFELVICGGSALIATGLVHRTTRDVDIVAMLKDGMVPSDPEPLPPELENAARKVAASLGLPTDWLNCGPCDLFRMGLPGGFLERLARRDIGANLTVFFIGRTDQIHFKLYASVDRGGYHIEDLLALQPSDDELVEAGKWSMTHDVSDGYKMMLKELLREINHGDAADRI